MATNRSYKDGDQLDVPVDAGVTSGDPVLFGIFPGVAMTDRDSDGNAVVQFAPSPVYRLTVTGSPSVEDSVYIDSSGDLSTDASESLYGVVVPEQEPLSEAFGSDIYNVKLAPQTV